jgi:hypothetical protein
MLLMELSFADVPVVVVKIVALVAMFLLYNVVVSWHHMSSILETVYVNPVWYI